MNEIWKPVVWYEGLYEVSNLGRVKSLNYRHTGNPGLLKIWKDRKGYGRVLLCKDGVITQFQVHRLVAEAFIPNPENLSVVNHKDENPLNNCVDNLEWCTYRYNNNYGSRNKKISNGVSKSVAQYTIDGQLIKVWNSANNAANELGCNAGHISECCRGSRNVHKGCVWRYT